DQDVTLKVLATGSVLVVTAGIRRRVTSTLPAMAGLVPAVTVTVGSRASVPVVDSTAGTGPLPPASVVPPAPATVTCDRSMDSAAVAGRVHSASPPRSRPPAIATSDCVAVSAAPPLGFDVAPPRIVQSANVAVDRSTVVNASEHRVNATAREFSTRATPTPTSSSTTVPTQFHTESGGTKTDPRKPPPRIRKTRPAGRSAIDSPAPYTPSACSSTPASQRTAMPCVTPRFAE